MAAMSEGQNRLVCGCGSEDCPADPADTAATRLVINVIAEQATVEGRSDNPGYLPGYGAVPASIPVTAKMRLGFDSPDGALDCARALVDGGAGQLVVHARTKVQGYRPPAHWEWVARVQEAVRVPVYANGEVWTLEDWQRCRAVSGVEDVMLGRGLVARPDLARQIAAARVGRVVEPMGWGELLPLLHEFWQRSRNRLAPRYAPGRLKQWLGMLTRGYPEAVGLFERIRREEDCDRIEALLRTEEKDVLLRAG